MSDQTPVHAERRRHPRYEILAQVRFRRADTIHILDVANISASGLFVRASTEAMLRQVHVGDRLELDLCTEYGTENIRVVARVVRIVGDGGPERWGFGFEFVEVRPATRRALDQLLAGAAAAARPPPLPSAPEPFVVLPPVVAGDDEPEGRR
ncbi:MAG: PilZ domain-containing protein [Myxococcales bacterium]|nr:PilZ domain-containing protein [Myxococcales bacterium]